MRLNPPPGTALLSPVLDSLVDPFGTSASQVGLMMSFFTAPPIVVIPLAGLLADRYGRKPVIVTSLLLFGLAGSAIALTTNFQVVLGLRLLQGVAFGADGRIITVEMKKALPPLRFGWQRSRSSARRASCTI
mgnify:CR=1 FL=1